MRLQVDLRTPETEPTSCRMPAPLVESVMTLELDDRDTRMLRLTLEAHVHALALELEWTRPADQRGELRGELDVLERLLGRIAGRPEAARSSA